MLAFHHFNFNVLDLDRSLAFYKETLGLVPAREKNAEDGSFKLVYLTDGHSDFTLELTWLRDRTTPYHLGICYENPAMGIYFISDPDGYWIEIIPARQ